MPVELTEAQLAELAAADGPMRVIDPRTATGYVLLSSADYEAVREALAEDARQRIIHGIGVRNAAGRLADEA